MNYLTKIFYASPKSPEWDLSDDDITLIENTLSTLNKLNRYHSSTISSSELQILYKTMQKYPCSMIFPVVDILKMCALHPDATSFAREGFWKLGKLIPWNRLHVLANCVQFYSYGRSNL